MKIMKMNLGARHPWLTPIILATQEAEIRRITVRSQPGGKKFLRPYLKKIHHKKGLAESGWSG
jgi:hypothetical protein